MPKFVMDRELTQMLQSVGRQFMNSFQPRPKAGRRQRRFPPSTPQPPQAPDAFRAISTSTCSAATGTPGSNQTPGTGLAQLYVPPADGSIGGTVWTPGQTGVLYENWTPQTVPTGTNIILRKSRTNPVNGGPLYEVIEYDKSISDDIRGFSYGTISAATGAKDGPRTPGTGQAKLHTMPTSGAVGAAWQVDPNPVSVENWMSGTIASYKPLLLRKSRRATNGSQIYTIVSEGCAEIGSG